MAQTFDPTADRCVDAQGIGLQYEAADQIRVDPARGLDRTPRRLFDLLHDLPRVVVRELDRSRQVEVQPTLVDRDETVELARDLLDLADPAALRDEP
jgi:hypothetical protein